MSPDHLSAHPSPQAIADATARGYPGGSYYVIDRGARIEFLWSGGNARRAHAALARSLAAIGIEALDVPGMGVLVMKTDAPRVFLKKGSR